MPVVYSAVGPTFKVMDALALKELPEVFGSVIDSGWG